ncbi:MAG: hypothetical protein RL367_2038, partial [Pseudomonadota bacterium]
GAFGIAVLVLARQMLKAADRAHGS